MNKKEYLLRLIKNELDFLSVAEYTQYFSQAVRELAYEKLKDDQEEFEKLLKIYLILDETCSKIYNIENPYPYSGPVA